MSAHICNDATTNALAQHALTRTGSTQERQRIANLLRAANTASVNSRYAENDAPTPIVYRATERAAGLTAIELIKLCDYFDCQAEEWDGYAKSEAAEVIVSIRSRAIQSLPGYADAEWGLSA